jgi:uracil-DNA glycosylase family 4
MERTVEAADDAVSVGEPGRTGVVEHLAPIDSVAAEAELLQLTRGVRQQLARLRDSGVTGVPRPKASARKAEPGRAGARSEFSAPSRPAPPIDATEPAPPRPQMPGPPQRLVAEHAPPSHHAAAIPHEQPVHHAAPIHPPAPPAPRLAPAGPPPGLRPPGPPASGRGFQLVEASYAELPAPGALRGRDGLAELQRLLGDCQRCKLCHGRNHVVFADGNPEAILAFVGEGPGADEDRLGRPFVGAAGQLLDRMIDAMAGEAKKRGYGELAPYLSRQAVYIANVVKCRPPGNRTPEIDEMAACSPFLRRQLAALPKLRAIVALGRTPTQYLLRSTAPISGLRGQFTPWEGIPVMPTYHPAYLLRTPSAKRQVWEDLQKVLEALAPSPMGTAAPSPPVSPEP